MGARDGYHNDVDDTAMVQKVLAELSPASGRCPQPGESGCDTTTPRVAGTSWRGGGCVDREVKSKEINMAAT
jgi:hypothetical protein